MSSSRALTTLTTATLRLALRLAPPADRDWLHDLRAEQATLPAGWARLRWSLAALGLALRWRLGALPRASVSVGAALAAVLAALLWLPWTPGSAPTALSVRPAANAESGAPVVAERQRLQAEPGGSADARAAAGAVSVAEAAAPPAGAPPAAESPSEPALATSDEAAANAANAADLTDVAEFAGDPANDPADAAALGASADEAHLDPRSDPRTASGAAPPNAVRLRATAVVAVRVRSLGTLPETRFEGQLERGDELRFALPVQIEVDDGGALLYALVESGGAAAAVAAPGADGALRSDALGAARSEAIDPMASARPLGPAGTAAELTLEGASSDAAPR